jgi:hypothetical protein
MSPERAVKVVRVGFSNSYRGTADRTPPLVNLKAVCGPLDIDDPQPAITVMLRDED